MNSKAFKIIRIAITVGVIAYGAWIFIGLVQNKKAASQVNSADAYTSADILTFQKHCFQSLPINVRYPEITKAYCDCYVEKVTKRYTKKQLEELGAISLRERDSMMNDIIVSCAKATGRDTIQ